MYSYAAMKAAEDKDIDKVKAETKTKSKDTKRRGKKNDEGTERADSRITKE